MSTMMQTVFLNGRKSASVVCRHCGRFKHFEAQRLAQYGGQMVPVKCTCGARFQVFLERRDMYRKPVSIEGWYWGCGACVGKQPMLLENLSQGGIRFRRGQKERIAVGDFLYVQFSLDETEIHCKVLVRDVSDDRIGAEFVNLDYKARQVIGFTLMV